WVGNVWMEVLFGSWVGIPGQTLYRTAILREAAGWNSESIPAEDQELWLRLARRGPVVIVPTVVLLNRVHGGQWRPANVPEIEERLRNLHVSELDGAQRASALRLIRARRLWATGVREYQSSSHVRAARSFAS